MSSRMQWAVKCGRMNIEGKRPKQRKEKEERSDSISRRGLASCLSILCLSRVYS